VSWLLAIPLLPAAAFALLAPLPRATRNALRWVPSVAMAGSLVGAIAAFAALLQAGGGEKPVYQASVVLATIGGKALSVGIQLDAVAGVMLLVITVVGMCVQIYSLGYMHRDERVGWYFAVLSLFSAAMLGLVLASDFLLLYMCWEVMGLCSYLLIGFWHQQEAPRLASIKAFLTTRVGDVGFAIGLAIMYATVGSFGFEAVLHGFPWTPALATAVSLCLLFGAMGKSAQVPLHVWLPDAMAGPAPASALIHAATMVAAGVYLVARALPLFEVSQVALTVTLVVGTATALLGGLLACVQHDIKKVLAYSTISQLGYMFIALGTGSAVAGLFHLMTHAFFKSLLFLGAGVIIHAAHTQDIREMGGLRKLMPWTTAAFSAGTLALAGVFPFSGFWSKDEILVALWNGGHYVVFALALFAAFLTAFYMTRLWIRVFAGPARTPDAPEAHVEMIVPMIVLGAITLVIGFSSPYFATLLGEKSGLLDLGLAFGSSAVATAGIVVGWWVFRTKGLDTEALKARFPQLYGIFDNKFFFDRTYEFLFVDSYRRLSDALWSFDGTVLDGAVNGFGRAWSAVSSGSWTFDSRVIDGAVNGLGDGVRWVGARVRRLQVGRVQTYQRLVMAAVIVLVLWIALKGV
jgi:NADH-quinone oxidoreductase subunit L